MADITTDYSKEQVVEIIHALIDRESLLAAIVRDSAHGTDTHHNARKAHDRVRGLIDHFAERLVTLR